MRAEPEGVAEWRVQGGKHLAAGGGMVGATAEGEIFGADEEARLKEAICALEGRVSMLTFRWPPS